MRTFFRQPVDDVLASLEHLVTARNPLTSLGPALIAMLATWFIYVGIHEMLHALGCVAAGGTVTRLEMSPLYGGALYAKLFHFVVVGSEYAGQVTGFTKKPDWIYLSTCFMPFVLTVLFGVTLVKLCAKRRMPILFGLAIVVGLAPFYNMQGDYYEMGSIFVTRALTFAAGGDYPPMFEGIRSDDIFKLFETFFTKPAELGLASAGQVAAAVPIILASLIVDVLLAFATYWMGHQVSRLFVSPRPVK